MSSADRITVLPFAFAAKAQVNDEGSRQTEPAPGLIL
jgi:hypothetical protein